ncbi:MAG: hypothetical protein OXN97_19260 [Bryobacterales bacterium]|nr:hypothetical protein [Bryobacterales bacterium]MDE0627393.1 hypothetical protein [Bryobacterales bacterium]
MQIDGSTLDVAANAEAFGRPAASGELSAPFGLDFSVSAGIVR